MAWPFSRVAKLERAHRGSEPGARRRRDGMGARVVMGGAGLMLTALACDGMDRLRVPGPGPPRLWGAPVTTIIGVQAVTAATMLVMTAYRLARAWCGLLSGTRRVTFDTTLLLWHYTVAQGVSGRAIVHGLPHVSG
jgi:cytochrome c oxidase subunit I+III